MKPTCSASFQFSPCPNLKNQSIHCRRPTISPNGDRHCLFGICLLALDFILLLLLPRLDEEMRMGAEKAAHCCRNRVNCLHKLTRQLPCLASPREKLGSNLS